MIYRIRVTLPGLKGFYRLYETGELTTLYAFHKRLQSDLELPLDQPILFKAEDAGASVVARYALVNLGYGLVDEVSIGKAIKDGAAQFEYFYDTKAKKKLILTVEETLNGDSSSPLVLLPDSKGPLPAEFDAGYVAFEDLPKEKRRLPDDYKDEDDDDDDDDEDDEGEDEDDEEEEQIVDEDEF